MPPQHPCPHPRPHPSSAPAPPQADRQDVKPAPTAHGPARCASTGGQNVEPVPAANTDAAERMQRGRAAESATPTMPATPAPCSSTCIVVFTAKTPDTAEATTSTKRKAPMGGKAATMRPVKKAATKGKAAAKGMTAAAKGQGEGEGGAKGKGKAKEKGKGKGKAIDEDKDEDEYDEDKEDKDEEDKEDEEDEEDNEEDEDELLGTDDEIDDGTHDFDD
ncbi:hypothetical protein FRC06_005082 [Ceratobasidium sp. 370]|nr:hypothetical protein FRC06_005082 [Ceratobasidium sp. 370]